MMHSNLKAILGVMTDKWHYRLTAISLVDAHLCTDAPKWVWFCSKNCACTCVCVCVSHWTQPRGRRLGG
jgi:hypothetical protein